MSEPQLVTNVAFDKITLQTEWWLFVFNVATSIQCHTLQIFCAYPHFHSNQTDTHRAVEASTCVTIKYN